jgi:plastocyanin
VAGPTDTAATDTAQSADAAVVTDGPPGSVAVGPTGGTVTLSAGKVVIPPGALTQTVFILFRFVNTNFPAIPGNQAPASSVVSLEPHGQTFAKPVTLTLNHFAGSAPAALYTAQPGGTFTAVPGVIFTATTVEANLDHFSYFVVAPTVGGVDAGADTASATPDAAGPSTKMIKVRGETLSFDPEGLEINVGDTVTWVWEASGHSVVSGGKGGPNAADCASDGKFASGVKNTGETFSFTFSTAGTYGFHCAAHCAQFEGGEIVVK